MGKKLLHNPTGFANSEVRYIDVDAAFLKSKVEELESMLEAANAKPQQIREVEKTVEVTRLVDSPRLLEKVKLLEQQLSDLKAKGAYRLVKDVISQPAMQQIQKATYKHIYIGIAGIILGSFGTWLISML